MNDRLVMEGTAYSQEDYARAEKVAQVYEGDVVNLIKLKDVRRNTGKEHLIQLDIQFMEVKKNALRTFGINWAPGSMPSSGASNISGGGGGDGLLSGLSGFSQSLIGFVFNLAPKIKFARQKGEARVLENPSFVVKSGEAAEFFSGTQVPYYSQQAVVFKDVGIKVTAEPISSAEDVDLKITVNVSTPAAGGINRGIDTSNIATTAYCKAGSSLALAGIFKNSDAKMINRVPEDINTSSALFSLFLSKDFVSNRSEFVVFVTPRIVTEPGDTANPASIGLSDWDALDRDITLKRSKKERAGGKKVEFKVPESLK
jgi:pilus assembly protein CpaC